MLITYLKLDADFENIKKPILFNIGFNNTN